MYLDDRWQECFQNQPWFHFSCRKFKEQSWRSRHQDDIICKARKQFLWQNIGHTPWYRRICIMCLLAKLHWWRYLIPDSCKKYQKDYWYQSCHRKLCDVNECLKCYRWIVSIIYHWFPQLYGMWHCQYLFCPVQGKTFKTYDKNSPLYWSFFYVLREW